MFPHQPAGVMRGLQPAVKWGQEGVSASHNWLERTVIAVLTDTITTLNVFVSISSSYHILDIQFTFTLTHVPLNHGQQGK